MKEEVGQALVEFMASLFPVILLGFGAAKVFAAEWDRFQCARLAFESAHSELIRIDSDDSASMSHWRWKVRYHSDERTVSASARCRAIEETISLQRLEEAEWRD